MDSVELALLIEKAIAAQRVVSPETVDAVCEPLHQAATAGAAAVEAGLRMLGHSDRDLRVVGCELLAHCCSGD